MLNIAVLISGNGTNLKALIDDRENINGSIKLVISNNENAYGLKRAKENNINAIYEKNEDKIIEILKENKIDLVVLAGYLKIISKKFVEEFENKIINIHPSLIPSFCGRGCYGDKVHENVLMRGCKISGATVHFVDSEADHGPIIMQESVAVYSYDDVNSLAKRVLSVEHKILVKSVRLYCLGKIKVIGKVVEIDEKESDYKC